MSTKELGKLSREELFEKVWSKSGTKLSEELGVSDVAIAKRCKKLNVPRPPRGYWAKLEAGHRLKRPELPPTPDQVFVHEAEKTVGRSLGLPTESELLHPLADAFLKALQSSTLSYDKKRVHFKQPAFPETEVSKEKSQRKASMTEVTFGEDMTGCSLKWKKSWWTSLWKSHRAAGLTIRIQEVTRWHLES